MNHHYKRLTLKLAGLLLLIGLLDRGAGTVLKRFYFTQHTGLQYRTTYAVEQTKADMLFFGSSRCNHHYNPVIFADSLTLSVYNVGRDGSRLPYEYAVLKSILSRYTPKIVFLDLLEDDFDDNRRAYDRLSSLLPYYDTHPEIRSVIGMRSQYEAVKLLSATYPYNSSLVTIIAGNSSWISQEPDCKGYLPLTAIWSGPVRRPTVTYHPAKIDERKIDLFRAFIADCKQHGIKLFVIVSPYLMSPGQTATLTLAHQIAQEQHIPFWNYADDAAFRRSPRLFADPIHLNAAGATQFSLRLAGRMCHPDPYDP